MRNVGAGDGVFDTPEKISERIQVFSKSVASRMAGAIFCVDEATLIEHVAYQKRLADQTFQYLSNILDVAVTIFVERKRDDWCYELRRVDCRRVEIRLEDVRRELDGLGVAAWLNGAGKLIPERVRAEVAKRLENWFRTMCIGSACAVDLILLCPNSMTTLEIQQSAIKVEEV